MQLAKTKIKAAYANKAQALRFMKDLGFEGVNVKQEGDDRISFTFQAYNPEGLDKVLGPHTTYESNQRWKFGTEGVIVVKPKSRIVVLKNSSRPASVKSVEPITDVKKGLPFSEKPIKAPVTKRSKPGLPEPKPAGSLRLPQSYLDRMKNAPSGVSTLPVIKTTPHDDKPLHIPGLPAKPSLVPLQSPNAPGSKVNDDTAVPHIEIPERLATEYAYAQSIRDHSYRIKFMHKLWDYFNAAKFGGKLPKPRSIQLMKDTRNPAKLRVRGQWLPFNRILQMAPRTFNAHLEFFAEIFLHEMCHQAVTDIDKYLDIEAGGHGPKWQAWMRKVGLNPRRYDPNANDVYMDRRELGNDPVALLKKKARTYHGIPLKTGDQVTFVWKDPATNKGHVLHNGRILGTSRGFWIIHDEDYPASIYITISNNIFPYQGSKSLHEGMAEFKKDLNHWMTKPDFEQVDMPKTLD